MSLATKTAGYGTTSVFIENSLASATNRGCELRSQREPQRLGDLFGRAFEHAPPNPLPLECLGNDDATSPGLLETLCDHREGA